MFYCCVSYLFKLRYVILALVCLLLMSKILFQGEDARQPHPLTVARSMHSAMRSNFESQCCMIAGEACSGKTEIGKTVLSGLLKHVNSEKPDLPYKINLVCAK